MLLKACDILNTIFQSLLFIWVSSNIVPKNNKISRTKSALLGGLIFCDVYFLTSYLKMNPTVANLVSLIIILLLLIIFYRKTIIDAFTGFFVAYFLVTATTYFIVIAYQHYFSKININISDELSMLFFVYIPVFMIYPIYYRLRKHIFNVGIFLRNLKHSIIIMQVMIYALLFINILFMDMVSTEMNEISKALLYIIAFIAFIFVAIYFAKINEKSKEVEALNEALNNKINELKKIKHDHGSEISSIYGLYQLGNMDRLGELLRSIVERNQTFTSAVNVDIQCNPLIASVLNTAVAAGINVINLDGADYENLPLTDDELLKLISNIIRNSIDASVHTANPIIKYNSYNNSDGIVIIIGNNGPDVPKEIRDKIFDMGFSTKDNNDGDRGFGLSIVMDILNKCNGKISIRNNREFVQFIIEIPYKA
jgi:signal transduction histidine kinase